MAARINKRFVLILFIVGGLAIGLVGGVWYMKVRTDVSRAVDRANEFLAQGDYRKARTYFARAVGKEPANLEYVASLENALLQIRPSTADEASELYRSYISVLRHAAVHHPADVSKHLRVLDELHRVSRLTGSYHYTEVMSEVADEMWERVPSADPERVRSRFYRGAAAVSPWMHDRLSDDEIAAGITDLEEFLAAFPDSDLGWSTLINGHYATMQRMLDAGQTTRADESIVAVRETLDRAREAVPDGPEIVTTALNIALTDYEEDERQVDPAACAADAARLPDLVRQQDDPWLYAQAGLTLQRLYWLPDRPSGVAVIEEYVVTHPDAYDLQMLQARIHFMRGELDEAEATARGIIDSQPTTVSFIAQVQDNLRRQALSLLVDVSVRRYDATDEVERPARLADIEAARDALAEMTTDPGNDPLLIRARGQVAFVQRDYAEAAALFNRLVMSGEGNDFQTRLYAALSMEQQGEIGAAVQLIDQAIEQQPGNVIVLMHQSRLRERMGQYEQATELVDKVLALQPDNAEAKAMRQKLAERLAPDASGVEARTRLAMDKASSAFLAGEYESARSTLVAELAEQPDNLVLLNGLIRVEITSGHPDDASVYVDRALEIAPDNATFRVYRTNLDNPDRVEAIVEYMTDVYPEERRRAVETLVTMAALVLQAEEAAQRHDAEGRPDDAAAARDEAQRAREAEAAYRAKVEEIAPENPRFVEYRFVKAIITSDWEEAERAIELAADVNVDKAGGAVLRGRYHAARGQYEDAVRSFREAVDRIPYSAMAWRMLAAAYGEMGNFPEALNAFGESYENNPNDIDTVLEYAQLLRRTGNMTRALLVVRNGRRLAPGNIRLRNLWLRVEEEAGDPAVGLRERRRIYRENPDDQQNAAALAMLLGATEPNRELLLDEDGEELYSNERWNRMPTTGQRSQEAVLARVKSEWRAEADRILDSLMPAGERNLRWHLLRAGMLRDQGDPGAGVEVLRGFAEEQPDGPEKLRALLALGVYEGQAGRFGASVATLTEAREHQGPDGYLADLALGELMYRLNQYPEAVDHLEVANEKSPTRQTRLMIADSLVKLGRFDDSRRYIEALEQDAPPDGSSTMLRAALALEEAKRLWEDGDATAADRKFEEHAAGLTQAAEMSRGDPMPYVMMAMGNLERFNRTGQAVLLDDALRDLTRADEIEVDLDQTSLTRIDVLEAKGDESGALAELTRIVERSPRQQGARRRLAEKLMNFGRFDQALVIVEKGVELSPTSPRWRSVLGDLYLTMLRDRQAALRKLDPRSREGVAKMAEIEQFRALADEQYAAALDIFTDARLIQKRAEGMLAPQPPRAKEAIELIERYPEEVENSPTLRAVYARALGTKAVDRREEAREQLAIAYREIKELIREGKQDPSVINLWFTNLALVFSRDGAGAAAQFVTELTEGTLNSYEYYYLATLWRMEGRDGLSRSIELFRKAAEALPPDDRLHQITVWSDLGIALIMTRQYEASLDVMQKVLAMDPDNIDVLNNFAYVLSVPLGRPEDGLAAAKRAAELAPEYEPVLDTLGWIYYQIEQFELAERYIRRAVAARPTAVNLLHMSHIYVRNGNDGMAMKNLTKAMELRPDADTETEINELADDIRTRKDQGQ